MAAEVAIVCGDPTEAKVACQAVTQVVDDNGALDNLTLLDQASFIPSERYFAKNGMTLIFLAT